MYALNKNNCKTRFDRLSSIYHGTINDMPFLDSSVITRYVPGFKTSSHVQDSTNTPLPVIKSVPHPIVKPGTYLVMAKKAYSYHDICCPNRS